MEARLMEELARMLGANFRKARCEKGLTQEEVAKKIGVSVELYSRMERGTVLPSVETFTTLYYVLDVPMEALIGSPDPRPRLRLIRGGRE
jgi:transcriptional regulator with XRE-family HTH domain